MHAEFPLIGEKTYTSLKRKINKCTALHCGDILSPGRQPEFSHMTRANLNQFLGQARRVAVFYRYNFFSSFFFNYCARSCRTHAWFSLPASYSLRLFDYHDNQKILTSNKHKKAARFGLKMYTHHS